MKNKRMIILLVGGVIMIGGAFAALYLPDMLSSGGEELMLLPIEGGDARIIISENQPALTGEAKAQMDIKKQIASLTGKDIESSAPKTMRDPFRLGFAFKESGEVAVPTTTGEVKKYLVLQGIFLTGDVRSAIIDDEIVQEGDWVSGWKVFKIYTNRVVLVKGGRQKTIYIKIGVE